MSSDLEEAAREPIPVEDVTEESSPQENADADGEREVSEAEEAPSNDEPKPKKRGASQRIGELVSLNKAKDQEIERLVRLLERGQTPQQASEDQDQEPKRDAYDDYEAYFDDRAAWRARQEFRQLSEKQQAESTRKQREQEAGEVEARWSQSHEAAADRYDDYDSIFHVVGTSINDDQANAIKMGDEPAEVVYYLGKNPKDFATFKGLSGQSLIKAVGRIEERISAQREQRSKAPPPVKPVRGSQPSSNALLDDLPIDEWVRRRNKEVYGA